MWFIHRKGVGQTIQQGQAGETVSDAGSTPTAIGRRDLLEAASVAAALAAFAGPAVASIALGWRHYYIQGNEYNPLRGPYAEDARYQESSRLVVSEIAAMRNEVRSKGWAESREVFFARDQLKVTGAR